jgi:hypothetical protein
MIMKNWSAVRVLLLIKCGVFSWASAWGAGRASPHSNAPHSNLVSTVAVVAGRLCLGAAVLSFHPSVLSHSWSRLGSFYFPSVGGWFSLLRVAAERRSTGGYPHWQFFESIDEDLNSLSRVIEFDQRNFATFSVCGCLFWRLKNYAG